MTKFNLTQTQIPKGWSKLKTGEQVLKGDRFYWKIGATLKPPADEWMPIIKSQMLWVSPTDKLLYIREQKD